MPDYKFLLRRVTAIQTDSEILEWADLLEKALQSRGLDVIVRFGDEAIEDALTEKSPNPFERIPRYGPFLVKGDIVVIILNCRGLFYEPSAHRWGDIFKGGTGVRVFWLCLKACGGDVEHLGEKIIIGEEFTNNVRSIGAPLSNHFLPTLENADELIDYLSVITKTSAWPQPKAPRSLAIQDLRLSYYVPFYTSIEALERAEEEMCFNSRSGWDFFGEGSGYEDSDSTAPHLLKWVKIDRFIQPIRSHLKDGWQWPTKQLDNSGITLDEFLREHPEFRGRELPSHMLEAFAVFEETAKIGFDAKLEYRKLVETLTAQDFLNPCDLTNSITVDIEIDNDFGGPKLSVLVVFPESVNSRFFSRLYNPRGFDLVRKYIIRMVDVDADFKEESVERVSVPSLLEQSRIITEIWYDCHLLYHRSKVLTGGGSSDERLPDAFEKRELVRFRQSIVNDILRNRPGQISDYERISSPLPYFFETHLINFERADQRLKRDAAVLCFQGLLRLTCLVGLEELHHRRNRIDRLTLPNQDLFSSLARRPSLGHWDQCLTYLSRLGTGLPVWGGWVAVMRKHLSEFGDLIELRNRMAHPEGILSYGDESKIISRFSLFFNSVSKALRDESRVLKFDIVLDREYSIDDDGIGIHTFRTLDLKCASRYFPERRFNTDHTIGGLIGDKSLICLGSCGFFPLRNYFITRLNGPELTSIHVYERDYDGGQGFAVDTISGRGDVVGLPEGMFTFV
jgi:hypothetical protein